MSLISFAVPNANKTSTLVQVDGEDFSLADTLAKIEKSAIMWALDDAAGNRTVAAKALGMNRTTLVMKIRKYGIKDSPIDQWQSTTGASL